jgi:hypothetical protein
MFAQLTAYFQYRSAASDLANRLTLLLRSPVTMIEVLLATGTKPGDPPSKIYGEGLKDCHAFVRDILNQKAITHKSAARTLAGYEADVIANAGSTFVSMTHMPAGPVKENLSMVDVEPGRRIEYRIDGGFGPTGLLRSFSAFNSSIPDCIGIDLPLEVRRKVGLSGTGVLFWTSFDPIVNCDVWWYFCCPGVWKHCCRNYLVVCVVLTLCYIPVLVAGPLVKV